MALSFEWTKTAPTLANGVQWSDITAQVGGAQSGGSGDDAWVFQLTGVKLGWVSSNQLAVRMNYYHNENLSSMGKFTVKDADSDPTWSTVSSDSYASVSTMYCIITGISKNDYPKIYITLSIQDSSRTSKNVNGFELPDSINSGALKIKVNGEWKESSNIYIKVDGVWKKASSIYIKADGQWKQI